MEGTWTISIQPHSHIPSEKPTGKRLLFLHCSLIPVALHTVSSAIPREFSLIYGAVWYILVLLFIQKCHFLPFLGHSNGHFYGTKTFCCSCFSQLKQNQIELRVWLPILPTSRLANPFALSHLCTNSIPVIFARNYCLLKNTKSSVLAKSTQTSTYNHE